MSEKFKFEKAEERESAVEWIPIEKIMIDKEQMGKISRDKVERHKKELLEGKELLSIDALELEDGTFVIDGNGRHRYFAYLEQGYTNVPLNIKQREGFKPTRAPERLRDTKPIEKRERRQLREEKRKGIERP